MGLDEPLHDADLDHVHFSADGHDFVEQLPARPAQVGRITRRAALVTATFVVGLVLGVGMQVTGITGDGHSDATAPLSQQAPEPEQGPPSVGPTSVVRPTGHPTANVPGVDESDWSSASPVPVPSASAATPAATSSSAPGVDGRPTASPAPSTVATGGPAPASTAEPTTGVGQGSGTDGGQPSGRPSADGSVTKAPKSNGPDPAGPSNGGKDSTTPGLPTSRTPAPAPAPPAPPAPPTPPAPPVGQGAKLADSCAAGQLSIAAVDQQRSAEIEVKIKVRNRSGRPCRADGLVRAWITAEDGSAIGAPSPGAPGDETKEPVVAPRSGATATVRVKQAAQVDAGSCRPESGKGITVQVPGSDETTLIPLAGIVGCQDESVPLVSAETPVP